MINRTKMRNLKKMHGQGEKDAMKTNGVHRR